MIKTILIFFLLVLSILSIFTHYKISQVNNHYVTYQSGFKLVKNKPENYFFLKDVGDKIKWSIIISEDWAYYQHKGVDFNQLKIVIDDWRTKGFVSRGASTLTQQLVKNLFLTQKKTWWRKGLEIILALYLEKISTKQKILEQYLNHVHLGEGIYGIKEASHFYFKKHPKELSWNQAIFLANLLPSPMRYSQSFRQKELSPFMSDQRDRLKQKLIQAKLLQEMESLGELF